MVLWPAFAARAQGSSARDLTELSLEELSNVEVTSVSREEEPLSTAVAAIAVVTNEDLRRSGAMSVPEALRLVPGLHVGQVSASQWAVSSRGFSSVNSDKLLVLTDTRSIYTPLFSGVFWDVQDLLLEDVDRIEVIRGPGASLWGANAVNGVINITTKSTQDTQGTYFEGGGGTEDRAFGAVRYGGQLADGLTFRVFAKGMDHAPEFNTNGPPADNWKLGHLGARADWQVSNRDLVTFQGDTYSGDMGQVVPSVTVIGRPGPAGPLVAHVAGGDLLARWTHTLGTDSDLQLRAYYDGTHRDDPTYLDNLNTFDVDFQNRWKLPLRQELIWGANYRAMDDEDHGKGLLALNPPNALDYLVSGFIQDQIGLLRSLALTVGTKLERNSFSGFEYQPTGRVAYNFLPQHTLWGSVSRAVRVPTRIERDVDIDVTDPAASPLYRLLGNPSFGSEKLLAYELGYRYYAPPKLIVDVASYYNVYSGLASLELGTPFVDSTTGQTIVPLIDKNLTDGVAKGAEASVTFTPFRSLRLVVNYSFLLLTLHPNGNDINKAATYEGTSPRNQVGVQSFLDLPAHLQLDAFLRYVDALPASAQLGLGGETTPAYATLDARLAYQGIRQFDFSIVGQNLFQALHREFPGGTELRRAVYAKVAARF